MISFNNMNSVLNDMIDATIVDTNKTKILRQNICGDIEQYYIEKKQNTKDEYEAKLKQQERDLIKLIESKLITHELTNTGKIQCDSHTHRTTNAYQQCVNKKNKYQVPVELVYFSDIDDPRFEKKIKFLFSMFPTTMKKNMPINERYQRYKNLYEKLLTIEPLYNEIKAYYENALKILKRKGATDISDNVSNDNENIDSGIENDISIFDNDDDNDNDNDGIDNSISIFENDNCDYE